MDRLEAMSVFRSVVDEGSFTAAAKALRMPLASVSRKVSELESHLGSRLLTRSTRKLALTDAGMAYLTAARRILEEVEQAERAAAGEYLVPRGELVVTAPLMFGRLHVLPVVNDFLASHPEINVRLVLSDRNLHLIEDQVDLGLRIGALPDSDLVATRLGSMRTVVCAAPSLLAAHGCPRHPRELTGMPAVCFDVGVLAAGWRFNDPRTDMPFEVPVTPRLAVTTANAAVTAALAGTGLARLLAYQVHEAVEQGALRLVLEDFELEPAPVHLIHAGRELLPLKTRAFLDYAAPRLRRSLAEIAAG